MRMMRIFTPLLGALCLVACSITPPVQRATVHYDFPPPAKRQSSASLRSLDVVPSSWLAGNAMYYRLAYADANRREHFAGSRWSGQPSELLAIRLQGGLLPAASPGGQEASCRLRVDLDDFAQVFDSASSSRMVLTGRATLYGAQQAVLARRALAYNQPAGVDAASGVAASGPLLDALAADLQGWVEQACRATR
jgi:cholesterol transport system auxiliary component